MDQPNNISNQPPRSNEANASTNPQQQQLQVLSTLVQFYKTMRNPSTNKILNIERQFIDCQKRVLKVVEFRKDLQKVYEIDELKIQYRDELMQINSKFEKYQDIINRLTRQCQNKSNEILKLQLHIVKLQSMIRNQRNQNSQAKILSKIQQNIKQIRGSIYYLNEENYKLVSNGHKGDEDIESINRKRENVRSKEAFVESKMKFLKMKEQMLEESESYNQKYVTALKEAVSTYEEVFRAKIDKGDVQPNQHSDEQTKIKQQEYEKLCAAKIHWYEKELLRLKDIIQELTQSLRLQTTKNEQMQKEIRQKYMEEIGQLKRLIGENNQEMIRKNAQILDYKQKYSELEQQLRRSMEESNKIRAESKNCQEQLVKLDKENRKIKESFESIGRQKNELVETCQKLESENKKLAEEIKQVTKKYDENCLQLGQNLSEKQDRLNKVGLQLQELRVKHSQSQCKIKQMLAYRQEIERYKTECVQLQQKLQHSKQANHILTQQIRELRNNFIQLSQREQEAQQQLTNKQSTISFENLQQIKNQIQQSMQKQWQEYNKQMESILLEVCQMVKQEPASQKLIEANNKVQYV